MSRCTKCNEFLYTSFPNHKCPPMFLVWKTDDEEEYACKIHAVDEECAAEKWAEDDDCNSAEYSIVSGEEAEVFVKSEDGTVKKFKVSGESVPQYYATEYCGKEIK